MNEQFIKRLKSFMWGICDALVIAGLAWVSENLGVLELPIWIQGILALLLMQLTKWWNSRQFALGKTFFGRIK